MLRHNAAFYSVEARALAFARERRAPRAILQR